MNNSSGLDLPGIYGRCDREINCGYHINPYKDGYFRTLIDSQNYFHESLKKSSKKVFISEPKVLPISYIPDKVFERSRTNYDKNNFIIWLYEIFDKSIVDEVISLYPVGTSKHWHGATVFWQIDIKGYVRAGKIMLYESTNGKRMKGRRKYINWAHIVLGIKDFKLSQCLFGENLLAKFPDAPVGIVESEKTAIIASIYMPELIWLATGSLSNLTIKMCKELQGRNVFIFPDTGAYEVWKRKADEISLKVKTTRCKTFGFLDDIANKDQRVSGLDLADYFLNFDLMKFKKEYLKISNLVFSK